MFSFVQTIENVTKQFSLEYDIGTLSSVITPADLLPNKIFRREVMTLNMSADMLDGLLMGDDVTLMENKVHLVGTTTSNDLAGPDGHLHFPATKRARLVDM